MKKIIKIAKLELSLMFYSPIAWFVLIIFFIQSGLTFTELLYKYETNQQLGRPIKVLTKILFAGDKGILATIQNYLYLYIPLLTMGLMSKETSSGSIKLLYSSPVKVKEIILGKYLSMMVYNLLLAALLAVFIFVGNFTVVALDVKFVLGGIFGVYMLMCAYSAIGLFMSSLTNYQVVAAASTLAVLAIFNFIGSVGQSYDFIREITYWISINGRANYFVNGLLSSKDLIYFLLVITLFLLLTIIRLNNKRKTITFAKKAIVYVSLFIGFILLGYITSLPTINKYYDTTANKDRTLSKTSQDLIKKLEHNIHLTNYVNILHYSSSLGAPKNRISDESKFEKYRRFIPKMTMDYIYYYDSLPYNRDTTKTLLEKAKNAAKVLHINFKDVLSPKQIREQKDLKKEGNRLVRFIHYGNQTIPLRMFDDIFVYPGEKDISSTLKRLIQRPSLVGVLTGNGERNTYKNGDDSYKIVTKGLNVRGSLINSGYDVVDVNLSQIDSISTDLSVLVLSDPKEAYSSDQLKKIKNYIKAGGNMLIAGEPGRQAYLNPIVNPLGVSFSEGTLLQESRNYELDLIQSVFPIQETNPKLEYNQGAVVVSPKAVKLNYIDSTDFKISPILFTNVKNTWNRIRPFDLVTEKIQFDSILDQRIQAPTALSLTRKRSDKTEQKIIVIGDADFMSNAQATRNRPNNVNMSFTLRLFKWFSDNEYPISTNRPKSADTKILVDRSGIIWLKIILLGIVPLIIGILCVVILIKRKQK